MAKLPINTSIINLLDIDSIPEEKKQEIIEKATELIEIRTLERVIKSLGEDKINEFQKLLDDEDDGVYDFLKENNVDLLTITEEETRKVKKELLESAKELDN